MAEHGDTVNGANSSAVRGIEPQQPHPRHYPLDIPIPPFHRYEHRRLTARDILVHRLVGELMRPASDTDLLMTLPAKAETIPDRLRFVLADSFILNSTLRTAVDWAVSRDCSPQCAIVQGLSPVKRLSTDEFLLDVAMRYYLEVDDPVTRFWLSRSSVPHMPPELLAVWSRNTNSPVLTSFDAWIKEVRGNRRGKELSILSQYELARFRRLQSKPRLQETPGLYDGGASLPALRQMMDREAIGPQGSRRDTVWLNWTFNYTGPFLRPYTPDWVASGFPRHFILLPSWPSLRSGMVDNGWVYRELATNSNFAGAHEARRGRLRKRSASEPPPHSFWSTVIPGSRSLLYDITMDVMFPRMTMIQLDHRSRRRSLSRTHIEYMFDWSDDMRDTVDPRSASVRDKPLQHRRRKRQFAIPCANCAEASHRTADCIAPCGHCGAPNPHRGLKRARADWAEAIPSYKLRVHQNPHIASQCPVAPRNRCKCVPFPTFHTAARCGIPCRRDCGGQIFNKQHPNAMNCRSRCCMCGLRGHSGRECRLRRCRCGGAHLGQDCSWNPTCRVPGCDRFHCGIHCRECGSTEKPFIGFRCTKCLGFEESPRELSEQGKGRRRRARKRANDREPEGEEEEKRGCNDENGPPIKDETASPTATTAFTPSSPIVLPPTGNEKQVKSIFSDPRQAKDPGRVNR